MKSSIRSMDIDIEKWKVYKWSPTPLGRDACPTHMTSHSPTSHSRELLGTVKDYFKFIVFFFIFRSWDRHHASLTDCYPRTHQSASGCYGMLCRAGLVWCWFFKAAFENLKLIVFKCVFLESFLTCLCHFSSSLFGYPHIQGFFNLVLFFGFSLISLALCARENNYVCPKLTMDSVLNIEQGRWGL